METAKDGEEAGLVLRTTDIRSQMGSDEGKYHPEAHASSNIGVTEGTRISLMDLRHAPTEATSVALRRRLARRFSIIGAEQDFRVEVNGTEISVTDWDFYSKIEYCGHSVTSATSTRTDARIPARRSVSMAPSHRATRGR